jgi:hypothetical protein
MRVYAAAFSKSESQTCVRACLLACSTRFNQSYRRMIGYYIYIYIYIVDRQVRRIPIGIVCFKITKRTSRFEWESQDPLAKEVVIKNTPWKDSKRYAAMLPRRVYCATSVGTHHTTTPPKRQNEKEGNFLREDSLPTYYEK